MECDICEQEGVQIEYVDKLLHVGNEMIIVKSVPVFSCPNCRERYLTAETMYELERLKQHHKELAQQQYVDVLSFAAPVKPSQAMPVTQL